MNKNNYLNKLNLLLSQYDIPDETRKKIVDEYDYLWVQYESMENSSSAIERKLGNPESIVDNLVVGYNKKKDNISTNSKSLNEITKKYVSKINELNTSFIEKTKISEKMVKYRNLGIIFSIFPLLILIPYFFVSFSIRGAWAWSWQFFLLIPIMAILFFGPKRFILKLLAISPFISYIIYFTLGMTLGVWHPTWLVFFITPLLGLFSTTIKKK